MISKPVLGERGENHNLVHKAKRGLRNITITWCVGACWSWVWYITAYEMRAMLEYCRDLVIPLENQQSYAQRYVPLYIKLVLLAEDVLKLLQDGCDVVDLNVWFDQVCSLPADDFN